MVSSGPYTESLNFTHMFNKNDLHGPFPLIENIPGTLSYIISSNPDFSIFKYILRLSKMENIYNDPKINSTLFIPSDKALHNIPSDVFTSMDYYAARQFILSSTLRNKITRDIIEDSPASYFITQNKRNHLFITNINGRTYLNKDINVIHKDLHAINGIIHVIDALIAPIII
jgi:uncharacterized surface protein with fasciclin (FAS1) repeats